MSNHLLTVLFSRSRLMLQYTEDIGAALVCVQRREKKQMSATFRVPTESQFGEDWIGLEGGRADAVMGFSQMGGTVTCYSARMSSSRESPHIQRDIFNPPPAPKIKSPKVKKRLPGWVTLGKVELRIDP